MTEAERSAMIEGNLRLVHAVAWRYRSCAGWGRRFQLADLVQEGTIGLIRAVDLFDPSREKAFSTFAFHKIRGAILDAVRKVRSRHGNRDVQETMLFPEMLTGSIDEDGMAIDAFRSALPLLDRREPEIFAMLLSGYRLYEIGACLRVTEARICQIASAAVKAYRAQRVAA